MAARGLLPLPPTDLLCALTLLARDADATVQEAAKKTAAELPERVLSGVLQTEGALPPEVLDFFADVLSTREIYQSQLVLNQDTPDATIARIAAQASAAVLDLLAENQLRLLRDETIVRALITNVAARPVLVDSVTDFCVRNGLILEDLLAFVAAKRRVYGEAPLPPPSEKAEVLLKEAAAELLVESSAPLDEGKRLNLTQRVMRMSVSEKIKLAGRGNKEARTLLLRDSNKLVCLAAVRSPRITEGEVLGLANSRVVHEEVLRTIYSDREWVKSNQMKVNLVNNPKIPVAVSLKLLPHLGPSDLKTVMRNKNISPALVGLARKMVQAKIS